ncbi:hypothetical protein TNCV_1137201 [Trichonephila clavipes]|nr:hypothetical protein TNCV_1137201 [Trichonephila clavipes]
MAKMLRLVDEEGLVTAATEEDIVGFGTDTSGCNNFNGGQTIFVIFSSVCVVVVYVVESLQPERRPFGICYFGVIFAVFKSASTYGIFILVLITCISFSVFHFEHNFESDGWDWKQLTHLGSGVQSVEGCLQRPV